MQVIDLTGSTFGRLTVIQEALKKGNHRYWLCECTCGSIKEIAQSNLRAGKSTSCGCYATELAGKTYKAKFEKHGDHKERLYRIHKGMLNRCTKSWDSNYSRYGAMGIRVHHEWMEYTKFKEWALANGYTNSLTLDRKDSALDYCPENCRWVTYEIQARNRRKQKKPTSSQFIGVSKEKHSQEWLASICVSGLTHRIGYFSDEFLAAEARDNYIKEHQLHGFRLNF